MLQVFVLPPVVKHLPRHDLCSSFLAILIILLELCFSSGRAAGQGRPRSPQLDAGSPGGHGSRRGAAAGPWGLSGLALLAPAAGAEGLP